MKQISTQIRYLWSKDPLKLIEFINVLPFKVEWKGSYAINGTHYISFVVPDEALELKKDIISGSLD